MRFTKQKLLLAIGLFVVLFSFSSVPASLAQARGLVPCGGYSDDQGTREKPCSVTDIFALVARVTNWLIAMAGVYAVYKIVQASWGFTTALGNEETLTKLKGQITDAVVGLALVMMAFMLINFVTNFLLTRDLANQANSSCKLDLTDWKSYLAIDASKCTNLDDTTLHKPAQ